MFAMIHGFDFMFAMMTLNCCSGACTLALAFTKKRRSIAAFSACTSEGKASD